MAKTYAAPLTPESVNTGKIVFLVDPTSLRAANVDANGKLEVALDGGVDIGDVNLLNKASDAKIEPATEDGNLATLAAKDFATQTSLAAFLAANHIDLAAILAKQSADPATQTTLAAILADTAAIEVAAEATAVATQTTAHDTATQLLTLGAATISKTLVVGGVYEINSINCTTFAHTVDAVTDANKRIIRQIGDTRRFTATATTYYFWTEDGAALTAYLVRVA